jgi:hypothetical protein
VLDNVAAEDRTEGLVSKRHTFAKAANEPIIGQTGIVEPLPGQDQPPQRDVKTDDSA